MRTEISFQKLNRVTEMLGTCRKDVSRIHNDIRTVSGSLRQFEDDALIEVSQKLNKESENVMIISRKLSSMAETLSQIIFVYGDTEDDIQDLFENGTWKPKIYNTPKRNNLSNIRRKLTDMNLRFDI
jgi:hypothetical protein